jgi:DNA anti-recombination protein RmuC
MIVQEASPEPPAQAAPPGGGSGNPPGPAASVERIREILFGPQMHEYGQRFTRIEERLSQEGEELKAEVRRRLDSLETYARQEVDALGERVRTERGERTESLNRLSQTLTDSVKSLERRLIDSDERMSNSLRELRHSTFDRMKCIVDDLTGQISAMEGSQNRHIEELRGRSIDRFAFAGLLTELALRLRGEFTLTGLEESDGGPKP